MIKCISFIVFFGLLCSTGSLSACDACGCSASNIGIGLMTDYRSKLVWLLKLLLKMRMRMTKKFPKLEEKDYSFPHLLILKLKNGSQDFPIRCLLYSIILKTLLMRKRELRCIFLLFFNLL